MENYLPLIIASLSFSLFSMFHCAAMCGPLKASLVRGKYSSLLYHLGRFISYVSLALLIKHIAIAPLLKIIDHYDHIVLIVLTLLLFTSLLIVLTKLHKKYSSRISMKFLFYFRRVSTLQIKALFIGLLTGALPCGVLYGFLLSISMIESVEIIVLNTLIYTVVTGVGVNLSSSIFNFITKKIRFKKAYIIIPMYSLSLFIVFYRFFYSSFSKICFS